MRKRNKSCIKKSRGSKLIAFKKRGENNMENTNMHNMKYNMINNIFIKTEMNVIIHTCPSCYVSVRDSNHNLRIDLLCTYSTGYILLQEGRILKDADVVFCPFVFTGESWSLEHMLAFLNSHYNKKVLMEMFVWPDDRDSSCHIIHVKRTVS